jgi:hypothetical protein
LQEKNNNIIYTAADIARYHKGDLSTKEMHALEKAALDDPFLADALEGYQDSGQDPKPALTDLRSRLAARIEEEQKTMTPSLVRKMSVSWWKVAAMFILVAGAAFLTYRLAFDDRSKEIAQNPASQSTSTRQDTTAGNSGGISSPDTTKAFAQPGEVTDAQQSRAKQPSSSNTPVPSKNKTAAPLKTERADQYETAQAATHEEAAIATNQEKQLNNRNEGFEQKREDYESSSRAVDTTNLRANTSPATAAKRKMVSIATRHIFKGRITDAANNPLPFSNITNIEDNIGTYSDAKGYFVLTSPDSLLKVQVSSVGFESSLIELHQGVPAHAISLKEDPNIPEVVIARSKVNTKRVRQFGNTAEEAEPQDGWDNYDTYLVNNVQLPAFVKGAGEKNMGEVELSFEVDKDGKPQNIAVRKSLCSSCDQEAIRLVKEGPRWKRKTKKAKATVNIAF